LSGGCGLDYYRARYYNPAIGRFLSEDPLGSAGSGANLYAYAGNNPISFRDSFGLKPGPPSKCSGHGTGCHASNTLFSPSLLALIIGTEIIGGGPEDPFADAAVAGEIAAAEEAAGAAAEAAAEERPFAIGYRYDLDRFSELTDSQNYTDFPEQNWRQLVTDKLNNPDVTVNVNLNGVENPWSLAQQGVQGKSGFGWELNEIRVGNYDGPIQFWQNDVLIQNPFQ
jgi:hypothetical protein